MGPVPSIPGKVAGMEEPLRGPMPATMLPKMEVEKAKRRTGRFFIVETAFIYTSVMFLVTTSHRKKFCFIWLLGPKGVVPPPFPGGL
jgi:hypothetical protein